MASPAPPFASPLPTLPKAALAHAKLGQVEPPHVVGGAKAGILLPSLNRVEPPPPSESRFAGFITFDPIYVDR